ncbi:hypothetical protein TraAM80_00259 [Trypanosoma rangeli]|uniref:RRM domain-containing protein n=1 Tax=Trypanosoma rangeli TaxID=5698 RepID=A0A3R7MWW1_TRYRA|nr:uncharacterized protein TraAM80_00259 [Trypanosoma rangeli]RNF12543.1 hypothetical protein TraAM80_00259 [Trypanosoma rangeli]|eukprot:RNF12543.1 hypothetical protein TraAM80_00259 [Trypanosoma rangeli]
MFKLFVSKLPKSVSAEETGDFLATLFPEAVHIQLLQGSRSGTHKGHAYLHFKSEVAVTDALRRLEEGPPLIFHEVSIHVKRASRVETVEHGSLPPQTLPPQLAHYAHSMCATVSSSAVDALDGVVARYELSDGVTAVAFGSEVQMTAALESCRGNASRCLPPLLPELLSSHNTRKRRRGDKDDDGGSHRKEELKDFHDTGAGVGDGPLTLGSGADMVASYERRGLVPLTPATALTLLRDFMEGRGRIALKDHKGHIAVMLLPAHAAALE